MVRRKRRSGVWHHRVPDFKLVYCGPNSWVSKEELEFSFRGERLKISIIEDEDDDAGAILEQEKRLGI
jgi:hypothetical protein